MKTLRPLMMMLMCLGCLTASVSADENKAGGTTQPAQPDSAKPSTELTVAILDFSANDPAMPELGSQISEAMVAMLSGEPGFTLVDRSALERALQEHELNLSGVVETDRAIQIGKIVGARILVTGKAFSLGQQTFITAKLIGTETSLVEGVLVKRKAPEDIGELVIELAAKVTDQLRATGSRLVAQDDAGKDPLPKLKEALVKLKKPIVAVIVTEEHMARRPARPAVDPAVETEIKRLLQQCGFEIVDVKQNELADWARLVDKHSPDGWPRTLRRADIVITGEAFSEFGARIGNLVSCSARAEINLITREDGKVALAERETCRAVDLSENIAAKTALEKAGRALAIKILEHFAEPRTDSHGEAKTPTEVQRKKNG